jgi:hypothetical protein
MATTVNDAAPPPTTRWPHARLIPTAGLRSDLEREKRASSCLLAVLHGVPEFGHALLKELGAPKSPVIETYAEVRFETDAGKVIVPDGAIVCRRGQRRWTCLVEVKTGTNDLRDDQVTGYLDIAREHGYDGVLTISNQITANPTESPVVLDGRKLKRVSLWHFSWWRIFTEALVQSRHRGVSDPDQAWILRELIHYLSSDGSGATGFEDMGPRWVEVRNAVAVASLRATDPGARAVSERWEQFTQYLCMSLSQELGREVTSPRPRKQTAAEHLAETVTRLSETGALTSTLRVPDAVGDIEICADLRARQTSTTVTLDAPRDRKAKARISWLVRQLADGPDDLKVEASYPSARQTIPATLAQVRQDPSKLLYPGDTSREAKSFAVTQTRQLGQKRGRDTGSFVRETSTQLVQFYRDLVQNLKPWQAPAPKMTSLTTAVTDQEPQDPRVILVPPEADSMPAPLPVPSEDPYPIATAAS